MDDLEALFTSAEDFKDDFIDFAITGAAGFAAFLAYDKFEEMIVSRIPVVGSTEVGRGLAAISIGVLGGGALRGVNKELATGIAVGLSIKGAAILLRKFVPSLIQGSVSGLGMTPMERRLLGAGVAGAPTMVEEVAGFGAAPSTVEEATAGLNDLAATFQ